MQSHAQRYYDRSTEISTPRQFSNGMNEQLCSGTTYENTFLILDVGIFLEKTETVVKL